MKINRHHTLVFLIICIYCLLHGLSLTALPVFADESIYIRWTQLMIDDWQRYLFFPLNDGKTPLAFWLLIPWQFLPIDQLASARLLIGLVGILQMVSTAWVTKLLGGNKRSQLIALLFTGFLPFWYFHHNVFLLDGLLTLLLTLYMGSNVVLMKKTDDLLKTYSHKNHKQLIRDILVFKPVLSHILISSLALGAALLTKIPALLAIPALSLCIFFSVKSTQGILTRAVSFGLTVCGGIALFGLLIISPAFPQLFSRGSDFLFPLNTLIFEGVWKDTLASIPNYLYTFFVYLTPTISILNLTGLFIKKHQSRAHLLFWSGVVFLLPIMLMGRVVYPRYLFPAAVFFTINAALILEYFIEWFQTQKATILGSLVGLCLALMLANTVATSGLFIYYFIFDTDQLPLVSADREQYLTEWSSGHGITQTVALIHSIAEKQKVAVATEGSFGTLPDGIMIYLHRRPVENIFVDGIGFPLKEITPQFLTKTADFERFLLVANSDRIATSELDTNKMELLAEFCRPYNASCLQVWDFTTMQPELLKIIQQK